jgi:hypothetical protein
MGMGPITAVIPRPSTIRLGSEDYMVGEFRLIDLADLQAFLDDRHNDPIGWLREDIARDGAEAYERELAIAYGEADQPYGFIHGEWNPRDPQERLDQALHFMLIALKQYQPETTVEDVRLIAETLELGQMSLLNRAAWGTAPLDEIGNLLGFKHRKERTSLTWPKAIVETVAAYPGYTLRDVYQLTLSEFWYLRSGGNPKPIGQWEIRGSIKKASEERAAWYKRLMARPPKKVKPSVQS